MRQTTLLNYLEPYSMTKLSRKMDEALEKHDYNRFWKLLAEFVNSV